MKKIITVLVFTICIAIQGLLAQDIAVAKKYYDAKDYINAEKQINICVLNAATPKAKAEALYWKHKIFYAIASDKALQAKFATARITGFLALKEYFNLEKDLETMTKDGFLTDYTKPVEAYYNDFRVEGGASLDKGNYKKSVEELKNALLVSTFFYEQKWTNSALDTNIVFYTGYAAMKAGIDLDAVNYFTKLYNASAKGTDLQIAYGWLGNYLMETQKDTVKAKPVIELGLKLYPTDEYLQSLQLKIVQSTNDQNSIFATHEAIIAKASATHSDYLRYGADLFDYIHTDNKVITEADKLAKTKRFEEVMQKALTIKPNSAETNYLMGMHYSQLVLATNNKLEQIKNLQDAQNEKTRIEYRATTEKNSNAAITYLEKAVEQFALLGTEIKTNTKEHHRQALNNLVYFYNYKNDTAKVDVYKEMLKKLKN